MRFMLRMRLHLRALTSFILLFSAIGISNLSPASAAVDGKSQLMTLPWPLEDRAVVVSVGINKQNISGRKGTPVTFVPYYILGQTAGTGAAITPSDFYATLAYSVKGPDGKEIEFAAYKEDVVGKNAIGNVNHPSAELEKQKDANGNVVTTNGTPISFMPNQLGSYLVTVWHDYNEDGVQNRGEAVATTTFTINYEYPYLLSYANYGNALGGMSADSYGSLTKVCLTANGYAVNLDSSEYFSVTTDSATEIFDSVSKWVGGNFGMLDDANTATYTLTSANFGPNGCAYINHYNTADVPGQVKFTFTGHGGGLEGKLTEISTPVYVSRINYPPTAAAARVVTNTSNLSGSYSANPSATAAAVGQPGTLFQIGTPISATGTVTLSTNTSAAGKSLLMRVIDTDGKLTGLKGATYMVTLYSGLGAAAPFTVATTFYSYLARDESYMVYVQGNNSLESGNLTGTVAVKVFTQDRFAKSIVGNPAILRGKVGETITAYLQVKDQFNTLLPNAAVIPIVSGRNSNNGNMPAYLTDAYGRISYTLKDSATDNFNMIDTVSALDINGQKLLGAGLTINYGPYQAVDSIKITGAASEDTYTQYTKNYIDTSSTGASGVTVPISATLYDANGGVLPPGVKVSWFTKGLDGKVFIPTDSATGTNYTSSYTDTSGSASTYVYSLATGDVEVFATVDNVTSKIPGKIHFANTPTDARIIKVTTTDGWMKARVEDRYGNPVEGVDLTFARLSGKGYIPGRATLSINALTDKNGELEIAVTGGDATFEISTTTNFFGQTGSETGYVNGSLVSTSSAGGALTAAGVSKVKVDVKSRDIEGEILAASEVAMNASLKSIEAAERSADKADAAYAAAQKVNLKILEISTAVLDASNQIKKTLATLLLKIQKIQKKIG